MDDKDSYSYGNYTLTSHGDYMRGGEVKMKDGTTKSSGDKNAKSSDIAGNKNGAASSTSSGMDQNTLSKAIQEVLGIDPEKAWDKFVGTVTGAAQGAASKAMDLIGLQKENVNEKVNLMDIMRPEAMYGIGGMPPVFLHSTDPPAAGAGNTNSVGYHYMRHNISYGNFIVFKPGFLKWNLSSDSIGKLISDPGNAVAGTAAKLFAGDLSHHVQQLDTYWYDVARACRICIYLMRLENVGFPFATKIGGTKAGWEESIGNNLYAKDIVRHYAMGGMKAEQWKSIGLAFANSVSNRSSSIIVGGGIVSAEDAKNDFGVIPFFVNGNIEANQTLTSATGESPLKEALASTFGDTTSVMRTLLGRAGLQGSTLGDSALAFFTGNPLMPQVWQSSTFEKSYSVNFRFATHDGNPVSVFLNIMYPLIKLSLLALPLGIGGFQTSPPILKVFSPGTINTAYGMITSMNIAKTMTTLTEGGLPTEIDVAITVVDLNPYLYKERPGWFNKSVETSTGFTNFMATVIGRNITTIPASQIRKFNEDLKKAEFKDKGERALKNVWFGINNTINGIRSGFEDGKANWNMKTTEVKGSFSFIPSKTIPMGQPISTTDYSNFTQ